MTRLPSNLPWDAFFRDLPSYGLILDRELRIVAMSDLQLAAVGRNIEDIRGRFVFDVFPEDGERRQIVEAAFRGALAGERTRMTDLLYAIPVTDADGKPTGAMRDVYWSAEQHPVRDATGAVTHLIQTSRDVTRRVEAERLHDAITRELQHRVLNLFALVSALARQTASAAPDIATFRAKFDARLEAVARTHRFLTGDNWEGITLRRIVAREVEHIAEDNRENVRIEGPRIVLSADDAQILTLAIHELATNSLKYGVLGQHDGRLSICWEISEDGALSFEWREFGVGPTSGDAAPRRGFGSMILDRITPAQLHGSATRGFDDQGYTYRLTAPPRAPLPTDA